VKASTRADASGRGSSRQVRQLYQPRLAEMVAGSLRNEILTGRLTEGDTLPRQEDLLHDFKVSPPAVREALRILETEGLIRVRRGNVGGAVVHIPTPRHVAYMISLVLQVQQTSLYDVGAALRDLEPLCAAMCARRSDRSETVVPELEAVVQEQLDSIDDIVAYETAARRFHETIVAESGNETMILVLGALESVWTAHELTVHEVSPEPSMHIRRGFVQAHEKLTTAIAAGDAEGAAELARRHLDATQAFMRSADSRDEIVADLVRDTRLQ
jgi:DNA-binding FadR family transcriptional regulator